MIDDTLNHIRANKVYVKYLSKYLADMREEHIQAIVRADNPNMIMEHKGALALIHVIQEDLAVKPTTEDFYE